MSVIKNADRRLTWAAITGLGIMTEVGRWRPPMGCSTLAEPARSRRYLAHPTYSLLRRITGQPVVIVDYFLTSHRAVVGAAGTHRRPGSSHPVTNSGSWYIHQTCQIASALHYHAP